MRLQVSCLSARQKGSSLCREKKPESDEEAFITMQALSASSRGNWIVDSGATCHMCNDKELFNELKRFETPQEVTLGDGHALEVTAKGTVTLEMLLPDGSKKKCRLQDVLIVPTLLHSLLSVSKTSEAGKATRFDNSGCEILNEKTKSSHSALG